MMTFRQHYRWSTPYTIDFVNQVEFGAFGAIAGSTIQGLMQIHELLNLGNEREVNRAIIALLNAMVEQHREEKH